MKKFLKVFIIILLVLAVVGGTAYFFFRKNKEKNNTTVSIAVMLQSESKLKFNDDLIVVESIIKESNSSDTRMDLIISTNENLDKIIYSLSSYYIENETKINNEKISKQLKQVNSSRNLLSDMMREYNIKKDSSFFDKNAGANDLYSQACSYLTQYAIFANFINESITIVDKNADFKFSMFEIYANVVINTFTSTKMIDIKNTNEADDDIIIVESSNNIDKINTIFNMEGTDLIVINEYSINCNNFIKYYNSCDKTAFAKNFASNFVSVTSENQTTNEKLATYYLKLVYGI